MTKKKSASYPQEKRIPANALFTTPLTDSQRRSLRKLAAKPDSEIDYSDAPETDPPPSEVHPGRFYRPIKQLVSIRVDADVLAWFRGRGKRYQTYMNEVLRREMQTRPATDGEPSIPISNLKSTAAPAHPATTTRPKQNRK